MSLLFGSATTDCVDHGSAASLDNLDPFTMLMWVYPTTLTTNRRFYSKGAANLLRFSGAGGNVELFRNRATTATSFITNDTPLASLNAWYFVAASFDSSAGAGEVGNIYIGSLSALAAERTYGTATDGAGGINTDATASLGIGNVVGSVVALQGRIAVAAYVAKAMSLGEIRSWQFAPRKTAETRLFSVYGFNGVGTQPDWSGNGNHGTVTGATLAPHVPLPAPFGFSDVQPYAVSAAGVPVKDQYYRRMRQAG